VNVAAQKADPISLWHTIQKMIRLRKQHPAFSAGDLTWINGGSEADLAFFRTTANERLLLIHNLSPSSQLVNLDLYFPQLKWTDLLDDQLYIAIQHQLQFHLAPYQFLWQH
jgi:glycosidase